MAGKKEGKKGRFEEIKTSSIHEDITRAIMEEQLPGQLETDVDGNITETKGVGKKYKDRKTYTAEETLEALENMQTSGRKGVKLPRINLAFSPANYEFIKIMAQVRGQTYTEFVNDILREARETHADIYQKAMEFRNSL